MRWEFEVAAKKRRYEERLDAEDIIQDLLWDIINDL